MSMVQIGHYSAGHAIKTRPVSSSSLAEFGWSPYTDWDAKPKPKGWFARRIAVTVEVTRTSTWWREFHPLQRVEIVQAVIARFSRKHIEAAWRLGGEDAVDSLIIEVVTDIAIRRSAPWRPLNRQTGLRVVRMNRAERRKR